MTLNRFLRLFPVCLILAASLSSNNSSNTFALAKTNYPIISAPKSPDACDYNLTVLRDSPIAYWRLDESSGTTAINIGCLGSAVNGTYDTGVTLGVPGLIFDYANTAASFDGILHGGRVTIPNHIGINIDPLGYQYRTIELWFRANRLSGRQILYEQGGNKQGLVIYLNGDKLVVGASAHNGTITTSRWITSTNISTNSTYYIALVYEGDGSSNGKVTGYLNGSSFGSASATTNFGKIPFHDGGIGIGAVHDDICYPSGCITIEELDNFQGTIDEVALYNKVLSPERISDHSICSPTAVTLLSFQATPLVRQVQLTWETAMEVDVIGFNLFRSTNLEGERVRLNTDLIPSKATCSISGPSYEFFDKDVQAGVSYYYWLEFINSGGSTLFGPQQVTATYGIFLPTIRR